MANRLNVTTATGDAAVWSPIDESIIQLDAADPAAQVEILARCDASAPWFRIDTLVNNRNNFVRLPKFPFLMASILKNTAGQAIKLWDNL